MIDCFAQFTATDVLRATGGTLLCGPEDASFSGISIDSRKIKRGELFWAIRGERFNGNDFAMEALKMGASGVVTDNGRLPHDISDSYAMISVNSSLAALQSLASLNRERHPVPLVAVTGSNGKTTTKEILSNILKSRYEVHKNEGNLNNHIGVPLTLLGLHSDHDIAIVEMGMNSRGEIRELAKMARPDIGVITNIGEAHLEGLGDIENVKKAKGELLEAMGYEKRVVLNADDDAVMDLGRSAKSEVITFGFCKNADVMAHEVEMEWEKGTLFILSAEGKNIPVLLPTYGIHQLYNALAASAAAYTLGFELSEIREGLEAYEHFSGRMEIISESGITIINDSYNANPPSVRYALETMGTLTKERKIVVLGDMLELGERGGQIHHDLGVFASGVGIDIFLTLGTLADKAAKGAVHGGMDKGNVLSFANKDDLIKYLKSEISEGDWLLVKGSRGMKMEEITVGIVDHMQEKRKGDN